MLSLLVAVLITVVSIAVVTAKIGPGLDSEELHDLGDRREELQEEREEQREEQLEGDERNSGPGREPSPRAGGARPLRRRNDRGAQERKLRQRRRRSRRSGMSVESVSHSAS